MLIMEIGVGFICISVFIKVLYNVRKALKKAKSRKKRGRRRRKKSKKGGSVSEKGECVPEYVLGRKHACQGEGNAYD